MFFRKRADYPTLIKRREFIINYVNNNHRYLDWFALDLLTRELNKVEKQLRKYNID